MAFVQTAEWLLADRPPRGAFVGARAQLNGPARKAMRHLFAISGSALVHFLLLYFFLSKMLESGGEADLAGAKSESLLLFDLSDTKASEPERSEPAADQKQEQAKKQVSLPQPVTPQEWKMVQLPKGVATRTITAPSPAAGSSVTSMSGSVSGSAGTSGGRGNYDPYAGAAPQRMMPQFQLGLQPTPGTPSPPPISSRDPLELDQDILNMLRRLAKHDGDNGNALVLTTEIDLDGSIKKIVLTGGSSSLLKSVRKLLGRSPLYRVVSPLKKVEIRKINLR